MIFMRRLGGLKNVDLDSGDRVNSADKKPLN
jgi:hypothetical protein